MLSCNVLQGALRANYTWPLPAMDSWLSKDALCTEPQLWAGVNMKIVGGRPDGAQSVQSDEVVEVECHHMVIASNGQK